MYFIKYQLFPEKKKPQSTIFITIYIQVYIKSQFCQYLQFHSIDLICVLNE